MMPSLSDSATALFYRDVCAGLRAAPKTLPCKYLYDAEGSRLFDRICALPEYYPTRTEHRIMDLYISEMADTIGADVMVIEPGSGSGSKTRRLLEALDAPAGYVPIEISEDFLRQSVESLQHHFPELTIVPLGRDFTRPIEPSAIEGSCRRRLLFFPGSTIGNFTPAEAVRLMRQWADLVGRDGGLLIGVDLKKDIGTLKQAYDDAHGVTAAFNLNLLTRINRELNADFDLTRFDHEARYNASAGRIEMHLVSREEQDVHIDDQLFHFLSDETIHTENSHKYTLDEFRRLAAGAGWTLQKSWMDDRRYFSIHYLIAV